MAKRAFDHCAADYGRHRPAYPQAVVDLVDRYAPAGVIADVGAGTGIFARALARSHRRVIAADPSSQMLAHLDGASGVDRVCASAEATALADASVSAVACAQSFHWFNPPYALAEFARILVSGGLLALVWNNRDESDPFVDAFENLIARYNPTHRREYRTQDWAAKIAAAGAFGPTETIAIQSAWVLSQGDFIGFTRSVSYIRNVLSAGDRGRFEADLAGLLSHHFGAGRCTVPMNTRLWWCRRLADST